MVVVHGQVGVLRVEVRVLQCRGHYIRGRFARIGIETFHQRVADGRSHAEGGVRRQCPRRGGPCQEAEVLHAPGFHPERPFGLGIAFGQHPELRHAGRVLHVAVAARLVQLVRAQSRARRGRIGLYGIALVKQTFVVELFQQPPQRLDIPVVIRDVGMLHVHPIAHAVGQVFPLAGIFHHVLAASGVVVVYGNLFADVLFRDAQRFLHAQFHGQAVRVPPRLALHLEAAHGLVAAEHVFQRACQHMVYARQAVGGRGPS